MRILIADDHPLYREAARAQLERLFEHVVISEASTLDEVFDLTAGDSAPFDLYLIDFRMPGMSVEAVSRLVKAVPHAPVAVMSGTAESDDVRAMIQAGARGFIPKVATGKHFALAIEMLLAGGTSVPADVLLSPVGPEFPASTSSGGPAWLAMLTSRETEVLKGVARGLANKEIARELNLAEVTIKLHLRAVFRKIGARSRSEAAVIATKAGLA